MRINTRFVVMALCAVALVAFAGVSAACGQGDDPQWERVVSAQVSGDRPVKLHLGTHRLGDRVRLAWVLSGPEKPPVTLTLRIIDIHAGVGYGRSVSPQTDPEPVVRRDEQAISLTPGPSDYRIFFSQRFPRAQGPGYDIKLTIYTIR